jgi:hypothetical protein
MKLNSASLERAIDQWQADPVPEQHPAIPQLNQVFGDHTFFVDSDGLHIVEPGEPNAAGDPTGNVLRVARWSDDSHTSLVPQQPEPTGTVVVFDAAKPDGAA